MYVIFYIFIIGANNMSSSGQMISELPIRLVIGGMSGMMSTSFLQPIDTVKVLLQSPGAQYKLTNPFQIAKHLYRNEGISGFYRGLSSAWTRQSLYTSTRTGIYQTIYQNSIANGEELRLSKKILFGGFSGLLGSFLASPADLVLVRQQADRTLEQHAKRGYTSIFDGIRSIIRNEGVLTLWRGSGPVMARATVLNASMLSSYSHTKDYVNRNDYSSTVKRVAPLVVGGFFSAFNSLPFDYIKTNYQKEKNKTLMKKGYFSYAYHLFRTRGILSFYSSFPIYYARIAPHSAMTLFFIECFNSVILPNSK